MELNKTATKLWQQFNKWLRPYARTRFVIIVVVGYVALVLLVETFLLPDQMKSSQEIVCPQCGQRFAESFYDPQWIVQVLGVVFALGAAMLYRQFMPTVNVQVTPRWKDPQNNILALSLEVENNSRIGIYRHKNSVTLQVLEHTLPEDFDYLKEWVSTRERYFKKCEKDWDPNAEWSDPINVMTTEGVYEPEQVSRVEVLRKCTPGKWIHCLINCKCRLNPLGMWLRWQCHDSFTTTTWVAPADRAA